MLSPGAKHVSPLVTLDEKHKYAKRVSSCVAERILQGHCNVRLKSTGRHH